jgi:hypothetical protein
MNNCIFIKAVFESTDILKHINHLKFNQEMNIFIQYLNKLLDNFFHMLKLLFGKL